MQKKTEKEIKNEIIRIARELSVGRKIRQKALEIFQKAKIAKSDIGQKKDALPSAAIYIASRESEEFPLRIREISRVSGIKIGRIEKTAHKVADILGIELLSVNPVNFVYRFSVLLHLNKKTETEAIRIIRATERIKEKIKVCDPAGIAAAAIYIAGILKGKHRTQKDIEATTSVSTVTIKDRYRELVEETGIEVFI